MAARASQVVGESVRELQAGIQSGIKKLEEQDHPAAQLLDTLCSPYLDPMDRYGSFYSDEESEDDEEYSRTLSEDETTVSYHARRKKGGGGGGGGDADDTRSMDTGSFVSHSDDYSASHDDGGGTESNNNNNSQGRRGRSSTKRDSTASLSTAGPGQSEVSLATTAQSEDVATTASSVLPPLAAAPVSTHKKPLASSFAKRCYFTKAGIGGQTQHYEGLTLTGNVVLMLAAAMKLKGCPTICDEDLRRVEQTYPNQFSRLPDELLLSSGWRRISKYCHFSNKPIPDGMPFFRK